MKRAHVIGVCGAGMSGVAHLLQQEGYEVSGSDAGFYPPISDYVDRLGITTFEGYRPENIPHNVSLIVIGKNAKLTVEENEEVRHAFEHHKDAVKSFPEVLGEINQGQHNIVVAGSYGKSTLSSMITWILVQADKNPGYFIGAQAKNLEHPTDIGRGELFVLEGDEYPSAHWDDRSKFLHYNPSTVLLTAACHDHINIYPTLEDYHKPFQALLGQIETEGRLVACIDEENARMFYDAHTGEKTSYGFDPGAGWSCRNDVYGIRSTATITHQQQDIVEIETGLLGRHNIQNIIAAAAVLLGGEIVTKEEFVSGISSFVGLVRRLDRKVDEECSVPVYEGFGSSYEKARSAIEAMGLHFPGARLTVVFEPHTFTWRNRNAVDQYQTAFAGVDTVWIHEPPTQGAATHDQLSLDEILEAAQKGHADVRTFDHDNWQDIVSDQSEGDAVLLLSSANFDGLQEQIISAIDNQY